MHARRDHIQIQFGQTSALANSGQDSNSTWWTNGPRNGLQKHAETQARRRSIRARQGQTACGDSSAIRRSTPMPSETITWESLSWYWNTWYLSSIHSDKYYMCTNWCVTVCAFVCTFANFNACPLRRCKWQLRVPIKALQMTFRRTLSPPHTRLTCPEIWDQLKHAESTWQPAVKREV